MNLNKSITTSYQFVLVTECTTKVKFLKNKNI